MLLGGLISFLVLAIRVNNANLSEFSLDRVTAMDQILIDPVKNCNISVCSIPCTGYGHAPVCPTVVPQCISGCACVMPCGTRNLVCYETEYCLNTRRRFLKRKKTTVKN